MLASIILTRVYGLDDYNSIHCEWKENYGIIQFRSSYDTLLFKSNVASACNLKKLDVNCCETMKFIPNLSENEILIYNNVVGNSRAFLLSPNIQRNTEVHKTLTQICICGAVSMVAISASLTNDGNLSHFNFKSLVFSTNRGEFFPHYSANRMYFQLKIKQNGNLQRRFFFLYLQYSTLPLNRGFQGDNFFFPGLSCTDSPSE